MGRKEEGERKGKALRGGEGKGKGSGRKGVRGGEVEARGSI